MARMRPRTILSVAILALALPASAAQAAPLVRAKADSRQAAFRLPHSFLGISQEYNQVELLTGNSGTGVNQAIVALYDRLTAFNSGAPILRIGGGSTDETWFNPTNAQAPDGINFHLRPHVVDGIAAFARAAHARILPGLNFAHLDPALAIAEAVAFKDAIPSRLLLGFEVGNEPDFYPERPLWKREDGTFKNARGRRYGPRAYGREMLRFSRKLRPYTGRTPLVAPNVSLVPKWVDALPRLVRGPLRDFGFVGLHSYALNACEGEPGDPGFPTLRELLEDVTIRRATNAVVTAVQKVRRLRRDVRLTESNSVACGGAHGVSDTQAAALWTIDHLFAQWLAGVQGVDLHASSPLYRPFGAMFRGGMFSAIVSPPYYGMLLFAEATANRARLLAVTAFTQKRLANARAWAVYDSTTDEVRVVVINKETRRGGRAVIRIPRARRRAKLKLLRAPEPSSFDVTWAGRSFALPTSDGALQGRPRVATVKRRSKSRFRFRMPRASAALLTVRVRDRR